MRQSAVSFKVQGLSFEGVVAQQEEHNGSMPGVVICHPHPLYGGNMDNNVVLSLSFALAQEGFVTLRFNFRGVGNSEGEHTKGELEKQEALGALELLKAWPGVDSRRIGLAGAANEHEKSAKDGGGHSKLGDQRLARQLGSRPPATALAAIDAPAGGSAWSRTAHARIRRRGSGCATRGGKQQDAEPPQGTLCFLDQAGPKAETTRDQGTGRHPRERADQTSHRSMARREGQRENDDTSPDQATHPLAEPTFRGIENGRLVPRLAGIANGDHFRCGRPRALLIERLSFAPTPTPRWGR